LIGQALVFNLETAVGREKDVQDIDVHGEFEKRVVTLLVMSAFSNFPGASRACADFRDPTAVSRFKGTVAVLRVHGRPWQDVECCSTMKADNGFPILVTHVSEKNETIQAYSGYASVCDARHHPGCG
jgi:hypothetical protein